MRWQARQVDDLPGATVGLCHVLCPAGSDHQVASKEERLVFATEGMVFGVGHEERTHDRHTVDAGFAEGGVDIGQEHIATLDSGAAAVEHLFTEGPGLLVHTAVDAMVAHEGEEHAEGRPLCQQLGIGVLAEAADVRAVERLSAESERQRHGDTELHLVNRREVVTSPCSSIAVAAKEIGT